MGKKTFDVEIEQLSQDNKIRLAYFNASSRTSAFLKSVAEARDESKVEKARQRYGK